METQYEKVDDYTLKVIIQSPAPEPIVKIYEPREFYEQQILDITAQRDEMIALKEKEIQECREILEEMDRIGIIKKINSTPVERVFTK